MNNIEKEILNLKKSLLKMFFLVEAQWEKGANAIIEYDQDIAEEISSSENRINAQELKIDSECENIIATFIASNQDKKWWVLWIFIGGVFLITHSYSYFFSDFVGAFDSNGNPIGDGIADGDVSCLAC